MSRESEQRSKPARVRGGRTVAAAMGACLLGGLATFALADDQDVIDYREHIMKTMGEQVAIIGMILDERAPADDFATHVKVLAVTAATAKNAFQSEIPGGDAKPEIWENWDDFSARLDELSAATAELAQLASEGGVAAAAPHLKSALTCKGCHDRYRVPDED